MNISEAIQVLEEYNKWRKGAEIPQPDPVKIGMAIDIITGEWKDHHLIYVGEYTSHIKKP